MTFFNTTNETWNALVSYKVTAESQEKRIMKVFYHHGKMSASQCWMKLYTDEPLTSIRRGITTLMNEGKLRKTGTKVIGHYGKSEYVYELNTQQ